MSGRVSIEERQTLAASRVGPKSDKKDFAVSITIVIREEEGSVDDSTGFDRYFGRTMEELSME